MRVRALLVLIVGLAAWLRLYQFGAIPHGLHPDEGMNGANALQVLETGRPQVFYPENNGREGLYVNVAAVSIAMFGHTAGALRFPSAIFGILTVLGVYFLAAELFSRPAGLLAAFFLATSFWSIHFSRLALRANAAPFFLAWALYFLLLGVRRLPSRSPYAGLMIVAGVTYGLGFYTYIAYRATPLLVVAMLAHFGFHARREGWFDAWWKGSVAFLATATATVAPLLIYFAQNRGTFFGRTSQVSIFNGAHPALDLLANIWKTAQMCFFSGDQGWRHNYEGERQVFWPVAIFLAIGIAVAVQAVTNCIRRRSDWAAQSQICFPFAVALGWLVLAAVPAALSDSAPHALRALLMVPAVFILAALGAERVWSYLGQRIPAGLRTPVLVVFFLGLTYQPYHTYFDLWAPSPKVPLNFGGRLVDFAAQFSQFPPGVPRYLAVTYDGDLANGIPVLMTPFAYLTGSYTAKEQAETDIHYITPNGFYAKPPVPFSAKTFCEQVIASKPPGSVSCLNMRSHE
jgi:4-amino-4-deoxy-L-arabinose transferase-like glycosyltransferase